jgi:hypothetical protein
MADLTIAERLLYSTVKLTASQRGAEIGTGTGFFVSFIVSPEIRAPCIITNKHVIADSDRITAVCHTANDGKPSGRFVRCNLLTAHAVFHPDPNVDLCAIPFAEILEKADSAGTPLYCVNLTLDLVPDDGEWSSFDAIEDVLMVGCPNGISDETNNMPLVRRGITATSLGKLYNGRPEFLVDMACFPGSSGSPVFLYNPTGFMDRSTNQYMVGQGRIKLVGVLYAGPEITNTGQVILAKSPRFEVATMMHLGIAVRSSEIRAIEAEVARKAAAELRRADRAPA